LAADLGDDLSTAQATLLEVAAQDVALLAMADSWLREHADAVINRGRKTFVPPVAERLRVASHLADTLRLLGLERRARPVPSLAAFIAASQWMRSISRPSDGTPTGPPRPGGYPEAVAVVGVQSGKSKVAAVLAVHAALTGQADARPPRDGSSSRSAMPSGRGAQAVPAARNSGQSVARAARASRSAGPFTSSVRRGGC
jgi:hypothetical protein